ncbi:cytochrome c biogenesis CcdA family protein [Anaerorhabdus sp.]|uniref:cytochrome c biogenesis CcdA family protein n=1 Tax=Anaerorhabdus sp. TaxID=1872524 RepID=UPI002FC5D1CD
MNETLYLSTVFIGGFLSFMSPCILPLLPVYFSMFAAEATEGDIKEGKSRRIRMILKTLTFVLGVSTIFVILGFGAGQFSAIINNRYFLTVMGVIVIILGIHQTGLINFKILNFEKRIQLKKQANNNYFSIYLLGLTFSFGWTPCIGPILTAVLSLAASGNNSTYGAILMAIYSLGFALPFIIISFFADILLSKMKKLNKHLHTIKVVGGIIIILMGVLLMSDSLYLITTLFER